MWGFLLGLAYGFGVGGLFQAFSLGPISLVGPLTAGYPVLTVLWGVANGLEPTLLQWACVAATLIGAIIIARSGTEEGGINAVEPGKMPLLLLFLRHVGPGLFRCRCAGPACRAGGGRDRGRLVVARHIASSPCCPSC